MKILDIKNLRKKYQTKKEEILAVDSFSYSIEQGEFIAIVGPSGCGKSSILSILSGLVKDYEGEFKFYNDSKIGYMLQNDNLFEFRTILNNCLLGLEIKKDLTEENKKYIIELLNNYGLSDFINSYPDNLSGGMRQRVALIRTLATKPDILLLDEPFSALDYQTRLIVSDDVYKILKKENKTAIIVTHDLAEAISMADKIIVMSKRPSIIKNIYEIKLDNKSTPIENRKDKKFSYYYDLIWKDIDHNV